MPNEKQPCGHNREAHHWSSHCYIMRLPIEKQLVYFIEHHGLSMAGNWNADPNKRGDVNTKGCYRALRETGAIDDNTVTLQLNTDGAQCFEVR